MRLIIAGSRNLIVPDAALAYGVQCFLKKYPTFFLTEIVSGNARGIDRQGETYAAAQGLLMHRFPANWARHGKAAGPIRNREMAKFADGAVVFWNCQSKGAENMHAAMLALDKPAMIFTYLRQAGDLRDLRNNPSAEKESS